MSPHPQITRPPEISSTETCVSLDAFFLKADDVDAWFERHSDILIVSFYNLATVGEHELPHPWFYGNILKHGYSVLGLIAHQKDWYRNQDTPRILSELRDAGLFEGFRRVLFVGASMGGFAAITYSALIPGSAVLAFSPQSTLAPNLVPFDKRYKGAQKRFDWTTPEFLDAPESVPSASDVTIIFDPFVPEDKAHVARLTGPNVTVLHAPHMGHQAIRMVKAVGALPVVFEGVAEGILVPQEFYRKMRGRRSQLRWLRQVFGHAAQQGHFPLMRSATQALNSEDPAISKYLKRLRKRIDHELSEREDHVLTVIDPAPEPPFTGQMAVLNNAFVVPQHENGPPAGFGVLDSDREWCELSRAWLQDRLTTNKPVITADSEVQKLAGTHLFAGHFRGHFGHFLFESTARLWAFDHVEKRPDSILYIPFGVAVPGQHKLIKQYQDFFGLLGFDMPIQSFGSNLQVERLIVPELGFGWGQRFGGSPAYRRFMRTRLSSVDTVGGSENLYVSRSQLTSQRGGVIGEQVIEDNLRQLGFEIFHPQRHSIDVQLSKYRTARRIVALDGSALHLVPFAMQPDCEVAVIKRRSTANVADYDLQFRKFCGVKIKVIDALKSNWASNQKGKIDFRSIGELDFPRVFQELTQLGFVPADFKPSLPSEQEQADLIEIAVTSRDGNLAPVET